MFKRSVYIIIMPLAVFMSTILLVSNLNEIYVLENGTIVKTTIIKKLYEGDHCTDLIFKYNGNVFYSSKKMEKEINIDSSKYKLGDTMSFFHLKSKPSVFVSGSYKIKNYLLEIIFYPC